MANPKSNSFQAPDDMYFDAYLYWISKNALDLVAFGGKCQTFVKCRRKKLKFTLDICQRKCKGQP
jgi:hypothetical protein